MKNFLVIFCLFFIATVKAEEIMQISIKSGDLEFICQLNQSGAAKDLIKQLPLKVKVENYSSNEKVFNPKQKLSTANTPLANGKIYSFAYFAPWNNLVLFYKKGSPFSGLFELGQCVQNVENISKFSGEIELSLKN